MKNIFIGCSTNSLPIARAIQDELSTYGLYRPVIWNQGVIEPGRFTIPALIAAVSKSDYSIFVFAGDDQIIDKKSRKKTYVPRDNVVYESGLAAGLLGLENCFIFKEKSAKLPTDFRGLTVINYAIPKGTDNIRSELAPAIHSFHEAVNRRPQGYSLSAKIHSWLDYCECITNLRKKLRRSPRSGGFHYDAIVCISHGGAVTADMLNHHTPNPVPLFCLEPNFDNSPNEMFVLGDRSRLDEILNALSHFNSILLVDDISRTGTTITEAKEFLKFYFHGTIRIAVAYVVANHKAKVDYYGAAVEDDSIPMPYSMIE